MVFRELRLQWPCLSFVAFFATLLIYAPSFDPFTDLPGFSSAIGVFGEASLICASLVSLGILFTALFGSSFLRLRFWVIMLAAILMVVGFSLLLYVLTPPR
jgi:hypothetical protein